MLRTANMVRKLLRDRSASVLVEFAIVLPILLTMFVGGFILTDMIATNRKVTIATRAITDMVSRSQPPSVVSANTDESTVAVAASLILLPRNLTYATETITLLRICNSSPAQAYVVWTQTVTQDNTGTVVTDPITMGSQSNPTIVNLPANEIAPIPGTNYYPLAPATTSAGPNINICPNTTGSGNTPLVGSAGAYLFFGQINYSYHPLFQFQGFGITPMSDSIYMSPRLS